MTQTMTTLNEIEEVLRAAHYEFDAIRARDGAPQHIDWYQGRPLQTSSCTHEYWDATTKNLSKALTQLAELREKYVLVPRNPTVAQLVAAGAFAMTVKINEEFDWSNYMSDLYKAMLAPAQTTEKQDDKT